MSFYKCSGCGYESMYKGDVKRHTEKKNKCCEEPEIISMEVEINCEYCGKSFSQLCGKLRHLKTCKEKYNTVNNTAKDQRIKELEDELKKEKVKNAAEVINNNDNETINKTKNKRKIPAAVRFKLWDDYYSESPVGKCAVCELPIKFVNFHAAHIVSIYNGGSDNITNLRPTCPVCNTSMGTMNMDEFISIYFYKITTH